MLSMVEKAFFFLLKIFCLLIFFNLLMSTDYKLFFSCLCATRHISSYTPSLSCPSTLLSRFPRTRQVYVFSPRARLPLHTHSSYHTNINLPYILTRLLKFTFVGISLTLI